jgi:hypothetical protein
VQEEPAAPVVVEFEIARAEFVPVVREVLARTLRNRTFISLSILFVIAGVLLLALPHGPPVPDVIVLGVGVWQFLMFGWLYRFVPVRAWKRSLPDRGPVSMEFSDDGVRARSKLIQSVSEWPFYSQTLERGELYLLKVARRTRSITYVIGPKRAFQSRSDEHRFRSLVERHTRATLQPPGP